MKYAYLISGAILSMQGLFIGSEYSVTLGSIFIATSHILNKLDKRGD